LLTAAGAGDGAQLAPHGALLGAGALGFAVPDAGGVDTGLVRNALTWAARLGVPVALGGADPGLARGVVHEGEVAAGLGLPGVPAEAEELAVLRAVALARLTGAWVHLSTVSTAGSVAIVRGAKAEGIAVSAEVALHHLVLDDTACAGFEPATRVNPPLRPGVHVEALRAAVADGTIDAVVTHHRPLRPADKETPFAEATPGIEAFETAFAVALNHSGLDVVDVCAAMSWRPAALLAAWALLGGGPVDPDAPPPGRLVPGAPADLVVLDPAAAVTVGPWPLAAHVAPHPYVGWPMAGRVMATVAAGRCIFMQNRG
jgi:dihydroorotase